MAKKSKEQSEKIIIDGTNAILGRLASYAAKQALKGKEVKIVNSEKVIVLGNERDIINKYLIRRRRHGSSQKGPIFPSDPEKILKRTIRGMLPHRKSRGGEVFKQIKCYVSIPEKLKDKKMVKGKRGKKGTSLLKISKRLKGK